MPEKYKARAEAKRYFSRGLARGEGSPGNLGEYAFPSFSRLFPAGALLAASCGQLQFQDEIAN